MIGLVKLPRQNAPGRNGVRFVFVIIKGSINSHVKQFEAVGFMLGGFSQLKHCDNDNARTSAVKLAKKRHSTRDCRKTMRGDPQYDSSEGLTQQHTAPYVVLCRNRQSHNPESSNQPTIVIITMRGHPQTGS